MARDPQPGCLFYEVYVLSIQQPDRFPGYLQRGGAQPWLSLEERSPRRLLTGLLAFALSWEDVSDWRVLLVALAPFHHCAQVLEMDIPRLFDQAGRYALPELTPHHETFGRRKDVTLGAFGWVAVETDYGLRLREG